MSWIKRLREPFSPLGRALRRSLRPPDYRSLLKRVDDLERNTSGLLRARHPGLLGDASPRERLRAAEFKVFSQNGEDGLLCHVFEAIGVTDRRFVEIGIGDGHECNTANLILNFDWQGLLVDCDAACVEGARRYYFDERRVEKQRLQIVESLVGPANVDSLLGERGLGGEIDLLSIDIDSNDYWLWKAVRAVQPRVVIIEYNASLGCDASRIVVFDPEFDARAVHPRGWYHGASLPALVELGRRRGYRLVGCDSAGVNALFVRADLGVGRLPEQTAEQAWYPHRRRLRRASAPAQLESLRDLPFADDPGD